MNLNDITFISCAEPFTENGDKGIRHMYKSEDDKIRFAFYWYDDDEENIYFSNLYVDPSIQKLGIGTKILNWFFRYAKQGTTTHYKNVILNVKKNSWVQKWYERLGFEYLEDCLGDYIGNVWMIKYLE